MMKYFILHKPYGMLSQFTREGNHPVLSDAYDFPKDVYPVGRLDHDSEGLLILTNDKRLNALLLSPEYKKQKTYAALVEGKPEAKHFEQLKKGLTINLKGVKHKVQAVHADYLPDFNPVERIPPVNYTKHDTHTWIKLVITEGKNRQVRRMMAGVGFPVLRLIRIGIENLFLNDLPSGAVRIVNGKDLYKSLNIAMPLQSK
jgi:23S rRNA pseudouridine2457 synthase